MKKYSIIYLLIVSAVAMGIVMMLGQFTFIDDIEKSTLDVRQLAFSPKTEVTDRIVMVWLDEQTMAELPYRSPVPRDFLAKLNDALAKAKPAAVGYDVYLKDPSFPRADRALASSLAGSNVYAVEPMRAPERAGIDGVIDPPLPLFADALKGLGLADLPIGAFDTKVRKARLAYTTDQGATPTFAALLYHSVSGSDAIEAVGAAWHWPHLGPLTFTPYFDDEGAIAIRFAGPPSHLGSNENVFHVFPARLVAQGVLPAKWFEDKIVLVGAAYSDMMDAYPTPYYSRSTNYARMNGVEIHANVLNQLLTGQFYYGMQEWQRLVWIVAIILICATCALFLAPLSAGVIVTAIAASIPVLAVYAFRTAGVVLPVVMPLAAVLVSVGMGVMMRALAEGRQKRFIKQMFSRYVPPAVVERIAKHPELARLGGEERVVTSVFTDIASFTSISENFEPTVLVSFLNQYLEKMNHVILGLGGTIDKYEGDAVIALFNAPLDVDDHQSKALRAAIEMQHATREVAEAWDDKLGRALVTRVGIHTGKAVVGNLGSEGRFDYTAIGDTINLASRLEGANKFYGTTILASEDTIDAASHDIITRKVDTIRVKGRDKPVIIHEVIATRDGLDPKKRDELIGPYREAYAVYAERRFGEANGLFKAIAERYPDDEPTRQAIARCQRAIENPEWDLVTELQSK